MKIGILAGLFSLILSATGILSTDLDRISLAIQTGNAKELAKYFDNNVEITIFDKEDTYSKAQAEMVLKDFFTKQKPASFKIIHNGNSNHSQYAIGTLITAQGSFRTYIYLKNKGENLYIQELRFERD